MASSPTLKVRFRRAYGWRELKRFRDRPAVYLTLAQARAYAAWVGGRLPDSPLFEAAAYGSESIWVAPSAVCL